MKNNIAPAATMSRLQSRLIIDETARVVPVIDTRIDWHCFRNVRREMNAIELIDL